MKKLNIFLFVAFLSGVYLMTSAHVFAGNNYSIMQTNANKFIGRLNFIEKKLPYEFTKTILDQLNIILINLKNVKKTISLEDKSYISRQVLSILEKLKISNSDDKSMHDKLSREALYMSSPMAPRLFPIEFIMMEEIEELEI